MSKHAPVAFKGNTLLALILLALVAVIIAYNPRASESGTPPFGGRASYVHPCFNSTIYSVIGPPTPGPYIWSASTRTYQNGPPQHAGQWLLGLKGGPYHCLAYVNPVTIWVGTHIIMLGTSK